MVRSAAADKNLVVDELVLVLVDVDVDVDVLVDVDVDVLVDVDVEVLVVMRSQSIQKTVRSSDGGSVEVKSLL